VDAPPVQTFRGRDGAELAYREMGSGRPVLLWHGFFSTGYTNWVRYGHAALLAERGFRVVMPDLRAHGESSRSHVPAAYPADVLTDDALALVEHLDLSDYDVGGYSLGARTVVRMLVRGALPRRAVVCGIGLPDVTEAAGRADYFRHVLTHLGTFERGTPEWLAEAFLKTVDGDPRALLLLLDTWVDTPLESVQAIDTPALLVVGEGDDRHDTARQLATALGAPAPVVVPGTHMSAVTKPDLGRVIADFLADPSEQ
jgi:pimeloyl-ACP methyl ester carboxylesterase